MCVCVCVCVCVYVCVCVCVRERERERERARERFCVRTYTRERAIKITVYCSTNVYIRICVCSMYTYVCMYVCMYVYVQRVSKLLLQRILKYYRAYKLLLYEQCTRSLWTKIRKPGETILREAEVHIEL